MIVRKMQIVLELNGGKYAVSITDDNGGGQGKDINPEAVQNLVDVVLWDNLLEMASADVG